MTAEAQQARGVVEVERADREAAALVFDRLARKAKHPATAALNRHYAKVIRAGEGDDFDAVQAAAMSRIRLAATSRPTPEADDLSASQRTERGALELLKREATETHRNRFAQRVWEVCNRALKGNPDYAN